VIKMAELPKSSGARPAESKNSVQHYFENHQKVAKSMLLQLFNQPLTTTFTCFVIGIALVLPALLSVLLANIESINQHWDGSPQITLLLKKGIPSLDAGVLAESISQKQSVTSSQFIDNEQALADFKDRFEFTDAIEFLDENPLPHAIIVRLNSTLSVISDIEQLRDSLLTLPEVDSAILDAAWVQRLQSITRLVERAVWVIAVMLSLTVVLVLGNTIRLAIENKKEEIIVVKLVGGTDPFVRRPFLYMGVFLGLGSSIIAWCLIHWVIYLLNGPIETLALSYQFDFSLSGLTFVSTLFLLIFGISLGWLSAWFAVRRHLDEIEPN
jgi:cell division transport system permease protein